MAVDQQNATLHSDLTMCNKLTALQLFYVLLQM